MSRSTPINALRRDEVQDPQTRDMVDGIVNGLEYSGGLPGGSGGYPGDEQFEGMHGNPQMMDYGVPPQGGGGYSPEFSGANMLPPGDPRGGGGQFPGDGQYPHPEEHHQPQFQQGPPPQDYQHHQPQYQQGPQGPQSSKGFVGNLTDMFSANSKEPMLAAALYLILSNDTVSTLLSRYIPYAATPMLGLIIRAVLVAVLFFLAKVFVLKR